MTKTDETRIVTIEGKKDSRNCHLKSIGVAAAGARIGLQGSGLGHDPDRREMRAEGE